MAYPSAIPPYTQRTGMIVTMVVAMEAGGLSPHAETDSAPARIRAPVPTRRHGVARGSTRATIS